MLLALILGLCLLLEVNATAYETSLLFLHQDIKVLQYELEITPFHILEDVETMTYSRNSSAFAGQVNISINVMKAVSEITLHASTTMTFEKIIISNGVDDMEYDFKSFTLRRNASDSSIVLYHSFNVQKYTIKIHYNNIVRTYHRKGLYFVSSQTQYLPETNTELISNLRNGDYLTTDLKPHNAKELMPCFDQPTMKAYFRLRINHPSGTVAISNTDPTVINDFRAIENYVSTSFARTPLMSTYLLAFTIGEFESIEQIADDGMILRMFGERTHMKHNKKSYELALNAAKEAYEFCSEYFDYPLPISKIDGVFVYMPDRITEFTPRGTENFGLINYDIENKDNYTVWYEIIHQWMGNTVTAHWWKDLWITEGFTTFLTHKFLNRDIDPTFSRHGKIRFNPELEEQYEKYWELEHDEWKRFGNAYSPAANVIRILEKLNGETRMHDFIKEMLRKFAYKNADLEDVLAFLPPTQYSEYMSDFLHSFMDQMGAPTLICELQYNSYLCIQRPSQHLNSDGSDRFTMPIIYEVNGETRVKWFPSHEFIVFIPFNTNDTVTFDGCGAIEYEF